MYLLVLKKPFICVHVDLLVLNRKYFKPISCVQIFEFWLALKIMLTTNYSITNYV